MLKPEHISESAVDLHEYKESWIPRLLWWSSGYEFTCQSRGHVFDPWSRKIPRAAERLSPRGTTAETCVRRAHAQQQEKPPQWEGCTPLLQSSLHSPQLEKAHAATKTQHNQKRKKEKKAESILKSVWYSRSGVGPEILHF